MTTIESPIMKLHDMTEEQFVKVITDIIVTTVAEEKCDDAINEIVSEYISSHEIMDADEVGQKIESEIESAIEDIDWQGKVDDAIDWNEKINEAIDENDAFDIEERARMALDTTITELRRDIHDLKVECNSLREHNKKSLDMVMSLLELIRAINNK